MNVKMPIYEQDKFHAQMVNLIEYNYMYEQNNTLKASEAIFPKVVVLQKDTKYSEPL